MQRWTFLDMDVDSFYPALMINHRLVPAHLPDAFLTEFDALRQKRLAAKAAGQTDLANGLKIAVNSIFGKSRSRRIPGCATRPSVCGPHY